MITASSSPRSQDLARPDDDDLRVAALNRLRSSGYAALRRLQCKVAEGVVFVHGVVPSYFLKQVAQTLIQQLEGFPRVRNLVEVRAPGRGEDPEGAFPGVLPKTISPRS